MKSPPRPFERRARPSSRVAATLLFLGAMLPACGVNPAPVPVEGSPTDLSRLVGEWHGEYRGAESGRSGRISFRLEAGADTAQGYVWLRPRGIEHSVDEMAAWFRAVQPQREEVQEAEPVPERLEIAFVEVETGTVSGVLEEYEDPECGCHLQTTFLGTLRGDVFEGTFLTLHRETGLEHHGSWTATRDQ